MKVIIDRFEGEIAVIELAIGKTINVPKELFPNAKEGDVFSIEFDKNENTNETESRKEKITSLMNDLFVD